MTDARVGLAVCAAFLLLWIDKAEPRCQQPGVIRSAVTLVPIDVRVLDHTGSPVTNLTADDFTILEDGVRQRVSHFAAEVLTPKAAASGSRPALRTTAGLEAFPVTHRTFLIVLGRGRLQDVTGGLDGVIALVRDRLLPQDLVAVTAFNRATDITTDHTAVLRLLERLRTKHEAIEAQLDQYFGLMQILYGSREIPVHIQKEIDATFGGPGMPRARELPLARPSEGSRVVDDLRRTLEAASPTSPESATAVGDAKEAYDDLLNLYMGVEYLRYVEGEKHLIHVTPQGMVGLRASENAGSLAAIAADARVAIHTIQTGGVPLKFSKSGVLQGRSAAQDWAYADARSVSDVTGGLSFLYDRAATAVERIDHATRSRYVLAYQPSNNSWDGKYRRIDVSVKRSDVRVLFRHGYFARQELVPYDRRQFMTYSRIATAAAWQGQVKDIPIGVNAAVTIRTRTGTELRVDIVVGRTGVEFVKEDGYHRAVLDLAIFVGNRDRKAVGEHWEKMNLKLDPASYARFERESIRFTTKVRVDGAPQHIKAVVYQYESDRLGSTSGRVR